MKRGATLIEILVVISIIAVLAALLLPLLSESKQASLKTVCANNLKQLGNAFFLYSSDWDCYFPAPGGLAGNYSYWSQSGRGGLESYINQRGVHTVWCCPLLNNWGGKYPPRTYTMNSYLRTPPDIEYPSCISILCGVYMDNIMEPANTILLFEGIPFDTGCEDIYYYIYRCANWSWARGYTNMVKYTLNPGKPWHQGRNNYLYCDGHIKSRKPGRKTTGTYSTYDEMFEWYVNKDYFHSRYSFLLNN